MPRKPYLCRYCGKRITRAEARLWNYACDQDAARTEGTTPSNRAYAAALLRLALAHARGTSPLVVDSRGRVYFWEAVE